MSDAIPLPPRPNLEQYKKQAKELVKAGSVRTWAANWLEKLAELQGVTPAPRQIDWVATRMEERWQKLSRRKPVLADAQFFIAREHGFESWAAFARHIEGMARASSPVSRFEAAADAIIDGDVATLERLLREDPELINARSTREHRSTLLHYVSANGVEDFRQKTPANSVQITRMLLDAGADVNAFSTAYGGRSTTVDLVATSVHPLQAGVQNALIEMLLDAGADLDVPGSSVNACLANGRREAAELLARHGARLDLEGAAGLGRLDLVKTLFDTATKEQIDSGFAWACEYGRTSVVEFLLDRGMEVDARIRNHGNTGLHWAACGGFADIVRLFLDRHARVDIEDETFRATPLGWALYCWGDRPAKERSDSYYEVVAMLVRAGANVDQERLTDEVRADSRMMAALRSES